MLCGWFCCCGCLGFFFFFHVRDLFKNKHQKQPGRKEGGQAEKQLSQSPVCLCSRAAVSRPRVCAMLQATARKFKAVGSRGWHGFSLHGISVPELFTSALPKRPKHLTPSSRFSCWLPSHRDSWYLTRRVKPVLWQSRGFIAKLSKHVVTVQEIPSGKVLYTSPDFTWKRGNYNCVEHFCSQKEVSQLPTRRLESPVLHIAVKSALSSVPVLVYTRTRTNGDCSCRVGQ